MKPSDIKESKIVEMLLGHNFSPQCFFVMERIRKNKTATIFLQYSYREKRIRGNLLPKFTPALLFFGLQFDTIKESEDFSQSQLMVSLYFFFSDDITSYISLHIISDIHACCWIMRYST